MLSSNCRITAGPQLQAAYRSFSGNAQFMIDTTKGKTGRVDYVDQAFEIVSYLEASVAT